ncbi:MAG: hypothetical protein Q9214_002729 [Letrouitia sp. 1 TL-2023]
MDDGMDDGMDDAMDDGLDDLFGDVPLDDGPAQLPNISIDPKGLQQSIDDLWLSGASQKLAWSSAGFIAYITQDRLRVTFQSLYCDPTDAQWKLTEGHETKLIPTMHNGQSLKDLCWNTAGIELAVSDVCGRINFYSVVNASNRCNVVRLNVPSSEDNLSAIVGRMWLNSDRALPLSRPLVKTPNGQWNFTTIRHKLTGPRNPNLFQDVPGKNKPAFVAVTRTGYIKLIFQGLDGSRWLDFKGELDSVGTSSELLTHAALCDDRDDSMLVATYGTSRQLRLYKVKIAWSKQTFIVDHLKISDDYFPHLQAEDNVAMKQSTHLPFVQLSHLEIISPCPDERSKDVLPALLLLVYTYVPSQLQESHPQGGSSSILLRAELQNAVPALHSSFERLGTRKSHSSLDGGNQVLNIGTVIAFSFCDGTIEFRGRADLEMLPRDETYNQALNLSQIGFEFPFDGPCLHTVLSPNSCAAVSIDEKYELKLRLLQTPLGGAVEQVDEGRCVAAFIELVTETFAFQSALCCQSYANQHDDITAVMRRFSTQHLNEELYGQYVQTFMSELYRFIGFSVDYSAETKPEVYFKSGIHQTTLSLQLSLGFNGNFRHSTLSGKLAYAILQLRWASLTFAMGLKNNSANMTPEEQLSRTARELNTPALSILLVSQSRLLLKYNCRFFRGISPEIINKSQDPTWSELAIMFQSYPVSISQFESILLEVEANMKKVYSSGSVSDSERRDIEKSMLFSGAIPEAIMPVVEALFTTTIKNLKEEVKAAELYFLDISWLGLSDDPGTDQWKKEHQLDVVHKTQIPNGKRVKRCVRCCSVKDDTVQAPKGVANWLTNMWRCCACGDWWMALGEDP